jgi:hypothetical protein
LTLIPFSNNILIQKPPLDSLALNIMGKILYNTNIQILIPVVVGFVLTFLPSILGILLITRGTRMDTYILHQRLNSLRWLIILLSLACQAPAIIYTLSLYNTEAFNIILRVSK